MTIRRSVLACLSLAALPLSIWAQPRRVRVAFFSEGTLETHRLYLDALRQGLRDRGYTEGDNLTLDVYWGHETIKPLGWMASDMIRTHPDVIVTTCAWTTRAAQKVTTSVPIVVALGEDPVASGLVKSLARPGGNVTGLSQQDIEITGKRVELLKQMVPKLTRLGVLVPPDDPGSQMAVREATRVGKILGIDVMPVEAWEKKELVRAFESFQQQRVEALLDLVGITVLFTNRKFVADLALLKRLPTIFFAGEFVEEGGLMSYGPNHREMFRRAGVFVDKIVKGAKPADLPIEQPTRFELLVNLKTARSLGLVVPQSILVRADRVIE